MESTSSVLNDVESLLVDGREYFASMVRLGGRTRKSPGWDSDPRQIRCRVSETLLHSTYVM